MKLQSSVCIKKLFCFFNFDQAKAQTTFFSKIKYFALPLLESTSDGKCHFMKNQWFARKQHAQLMLNLIQRCYGRSKFQDINF